MAESEDMVETEEMDNLDMMEQEMKKMAINLNQKVEVVPTVMEQLCVFLKEQKKILEEQQERLMDVIRRKELENKRLEEENLRQKLELQCLEEVLQQRNYMCELYENASKAMDKFKVFRGNLEADLGMKYPETNSEEEDPSSKPTEVIETQDEDNVMSVDSADISRMAKDQPLLHEAFLELRKSAQDFQTFRDVVKTKLASLDSRGASAAMAESKDRMKQEMEEVAIDLDNLKQEIDEQLEELKNAWRRYFGKAGKFHF